MEKQDVAARLVRFGEARWGSVKDFAEALDMSTNALNTGYLSGRSVPGAVVLERLFRNGCSTDWLLFGVGLPPAPTPHELNLYVEYLKAITVLFSQYRDALLAAEKELGMSVHKATYAAFVEKWQQLIEKYWHDKGEWPAPETQPTEEKKK